MRNQAEVAAMACPVCRVPLSMSDRQGIEIDYCPQCRGVWLDRGELDKIIERSAPPEAAQSAARPAPQPSAPLHPGPAQNPWAAGGLTHGGYGHGDASYGGGRGDHRTKRRKSWLEDIFD